jgi:hypothetical protein
MRPVIPVPLLVFPDNILPFYVERLHRRSRQPLRRCGLDHTVEFFLDSSSFEGERPREVGLTRANGGIFGDAGAVQSSKDDLLAQSLREIEGTDLLHQHRDCGLANGKGLRSLHPLD